MSEEHRAVNEFLELFQPVTEYAAYVLSKEGAEQVVLGPLGEYPNAAMHAADWLMTAPSSYVRCLGPLVLAFTPESDAGLLQELWEAEIALRDDPPPEIREQIEAADADPAAFGLPIGPEDDLDLGEQPGDEPAPKPPIEERVAFIASLEANSVAERFMIASLAYNGRGGEHREAAAAFWTDMVERALDGEAWDDAHLALAMLVRTGAPGADALLSRCAASHDDGHLGEWARQISRGNRALLDEPLKLAGPVPDDVELPGEIQEQLDASLDAARRLEEVIRSGL